MNETWNEQKIIFKNKEYILVGGGITIKEDFENGLCSYAHLYSNGEIKRFNKVIGTKDDITFTDEFIEVSPDLNNFLDGIFGNSWWRN